MSYILLTWLLAPIWWPISILRARRQTVPQRILIAEIAGIGDVVCSTAVFKAVRAAFPDVHIALMVDTVLKSLASQDTNLNEVVPFAYGAQRGFSGRWKLMRLMSSFDTVICLIPSAGQLTAACWAATPRRYSVLPDIPVTSYRWLSPLMTHVLAHESNTSFVGTQLRLLTPLGVRGNPENRSLCITDASRMKANALLAGGSTWIGLAIGSGQGIKAIAPQVLKTVIFELLKNPRFVIVLIGGGKEQGLAAKLMSDIEVSHRVRCFDETGKWPLDELPGLLVKLDCFIGVDSGVTYMADTLAIPLVYLPGPANPADQTPIRSRKIVLQKNLDCAPCSRVFVTPDHCAAKDHACIDAISAQEIVDAVNALLKKAP